MGRPTSLRFGSVLVEVGETRKKKLVNYTLNTGNTLKHLIIPLMDKEFDANPSLYQDHVPLSDLIKSCDNFPDKVMVVLSRAQKPVSKKYITGKIIKAEPTLNRNNLSILVDMALKKPIFFHYEEPAKAASGKRKEYTINRYYLPR